MNALPQPLPQSFYDRDVREVARDLIGARLCRATLIDECAAKTGLDPTQVIVGQIVEVEAYLASNDPASHSHRGRTKRNAAMFGPPGMAYVYQIHTHHCVNVVAEEEGRGAAVLIRAVEPLAGFELMRERRRRDDPRQWTSGPGKLCQALAINRSLDGWDLTAGEQLWIEAGRRALSVEIACSPRIGIRLAADLPLRFFATGNAHVSGPKRWWRNGAPSPATP